MVYIITIWISIFLTFLLENVECIHKCIECREVLRSEHHQQWLHSILSSYKRLNTEKNLNSTRVCRDLIVDNDAKISGVIDFFTETSGSFSWIMMQVP